MCLILLSFYAPGVYFPWDVFEVSLDLIQGLPAPAAIADRLINDWGSEEHSDHIELELMQPPTYLPPSFPAILWPLPFLSYFVDMQWNL